LFYKLQIIILLAFSAVVTAQHQREEEQHYPISEDHTYSFKKPDFFDMIRFVPKDIVQFGLFTVQRENLIWTGLTIASTAAITPLDQKITDLSIDLGEPIGWDEDHSYNKLFGVFRVIPNDINSAIYYVGNGGTTLLLSGGFYVFGKLSNNYRALNTANELVEVLLSVGIVTQTIKRLTGRQSPNRAMEAGHPGGHWTPFPSFKAYQNNTPNYDAMPSGHVATFMATITVITTNYPEIRWIKPVGYSLMGIMAFEMISSKVHWISDYPLAILIGYVIGKNAANRRIFKKDKADVIGVMNKPKIQTDFNFNMNSRLTTMGITFNF
jgi:hypothetical protein